MSIKIQWLEHIAAGIYSRIYPFKKKVVSHPYLNLRVQRPYTDILRGERFLAMGVTVTVWSCANFVSFWIRWVLEFNINESETKDIAVRALVSFEESIWILDIYNWTILWHSGQFFLISMAWKLPYTALIKLVYCCIWTKVQIPTYTGQIQT